MAAMNNELLAIFHEEVSDYLVVLNESLLRVEVAAGNDRRELVKEMNRVAHSMKGAARAVGLGLIETIAHYMEEIFHLALDRHMPITPQVADTLYDSLDLIQNVMAQQENDNEVVSAVLIALEKVVTDAAAVNDNGAVWTPPSIPDAYTTGEVSALLLEEDRAPLMDRLPPIEVTDTDTVPLGMIRSVDETLRVSIRKLDQLMAEVSELSVIRMRGDIRFGRAGKLRDRLSRWQRDWRSVRASYIRLIRRMQDNTHNMTPELASILKFLETNQRYLVDANRDMLTMYQLQAKDQLHLTTVTEDLQDRVANLRMMPFETISNGLQRMARDIARDLQKQIVLDIIGAHVEIDKAVLDALKEPLMHLLRNSLDHGIEAPLERAEMHKSPFGIIEISVDPRGSEILIQVRDDGRGLNPALLRYKAVEKGLVTQAAADALDDDAARMLIFQSGFSTQNEVTSLSGRGLGMDIVRERVENLRGRISVSSVLGRGMTTSINVPVSLTRIRCILLRVGDEEYAVPSVMIARMQHVQRAERYTARGKTMLQISGRPVPLVALADVLNVPTAHRDKETSEVLVLQALERMVAFEVDDLYSEMELVLKPLGHELANTPFVAGAALLGSGEVIVVLDANDLVRVGNGDTLLSRNRQPVTVREAEQRRLRVLVVDDSITTRTLEKNILETVGFEVFVAVNGLEAWTQLPDLMPDIIISDVEMPHMTGLELARRVKNDVRTRNIPLILLTSLNKPEQREAGLEAGADAYLVKSRFDQNELLATIQSVI